MDFLLRVEEAADGPQTIWSLENWLSNEPDFERKIRRVPVTPSPGELGAVADTLQIALGAGGAVAVLAASLQTWFAQPRRSDVRITVVNGDKKVTIDAKRVRDIPALLREVAQLDGTHTDAAP